MLNQRRKGGLEPSIEFHLVVVDRLSLDGRHFDKLGIATDDQLANLLLGRVVQVDLNVRVLPGELWARQTRLVFDGNEEVVDSSVERCQLVGAHKRPPRRTAHGHRPTRASRNQLCKPFVWHAAQCGQKGRRVLRRNHGASVVVKVFGVDRDSAHARSHARLWFSARAFLADSPPRSSARSG